MNYVVPREKSLKNGVCKRTFWDVLADRALATKPDDLYSILRALAVEENQLSELIPCHMSAKACLLSLLKKKKMLRERTF